MGKFGVLALTGVLVVAVLASAVDEVDFGNPSRSAAEDEIVDLPGLDHKPTFRQYSGYLAADDEQPTNRFWHYWFVESQSNPAKDPLVLWLNGGPGCSSLLGLLTELGPFRVVSNSSVTDNQYAWNKHANVLFVESPAGVGFSYAVDGDITADDDTTAAQNHRALRSFLQKFPQFKNNPLYLTGESYGGVYLPTLGVLVDADPEMNLKGIAIGNGYLDATKLAESLIYFNYYHGLFGKSIWSGLSKHCCDGKEPARGQCNFLADHSKECDSYMKKALDDILNSGLNPYNLYDQCYSGSSSNGQFRSRDTFDKSMMLHAFNMTRKRTYSKLRSGAQLFRHVAESPPCTDDSVTTTWLNQGEVRKALHIPAKLNIIFDTCSDIKYTMIYPASKDGLAPQMQSLIDSKRGLTMLVYNGDIDLMCNFFGDEWFVDDLGRTVTSNYSPWYTRGQVSGFVKKYNGITYMTVRGSGHMVPTDRPAEALHMFETYLLKLSKV